MGARTGAGTGTRIERTVEGKKSPGAYVVIVCVCMVSTFSRVCINPVRLLILLMVS